MRRLSAWLNTFQYKSHDQKKGKAKNIPNRQDILRIQYMIQNKTTRLRL